MSRWWESHGWVSIGAQASNSRAPYGRLKVSLVQQLQAALASVNFGPIEHFAIVLRIGDNFCESGNADCSRLRVMKAQGYVGCDIDIPDRDWQGLDESACRRKLAGLVVQAISTMLEGLKKKKFEGDYEMVEQVARRVCEDWGAGG